MYMGNEINDGKLGEIKLFVVDLCCTMRCRVKVNSMRKLNDD